MSYPNKLPPGDQLWKHFANMVNHFNQNKDSTDISDITPSIKFFSSALTNYRSWPVDFLHGSLALPWCLRYLINNEIIDNVPEVDSIFTDCLNRYRSYYYDSPIQYNPFDRLWPVGIVMLANIPSIKSNIYYSWFEDCVHRIRDCEQMLTSSIIGIYSPHMLTAGILHSIYYFLDCCRLRKIFPKKCIELIDCIANLKYDKENSRIIDIYILNKIMNGTCDISIDSSMINELEFFSFIYDKPALSREKG